MAAAVVAKGCGRKGDCCGSNLWRRLQGMAADVWVRQKVESSQQEHAKQDELAADDDGGAAGSK